MKKGKRITAWILLIIVLVILGFLSIVFFKNLKNQNEDDFVSDLNEMGSEVYAIYYYDEIAKEKTADELKTYLKKFEEIGLKFDLVQLSNYSDDYAKKIDNFIRVHKDCSKEDTMVIIYPKEPYSSTDFTTEIQMECGYNK